MNDFSQDTRVRLLVLLDAEIELFGRIYELTVKQAELLAADDIEEFNKSLDSRQILIEKINELHQEINILMQSYVSFAGSGTGRKIEAIEKAEAQRLDIIAQCAALNEKNNRAANEKADAYIKRIDKLNLTKKSLEIYTPELPNTPELFDRKT